MPKLDQMSRPLIYALALTLMAVVGAADYISGVEVSFSVFYLLPIALVAWVTGRRDGIVAAFAGALIWLLADSRRVYSHPVIPIWNATVRLSFFLIVVYILDELKRAMERDRSLARLDHLTGMANSKAFYEVAGAEVENCRQTGKPVTIAYLDCDHFKEVNDSLGHEAGDELLRVVALVMRGAVRATDIAARIGGDEFVFFLAGAPAEDAKNILDRMLDTMQVEMSRKQWPVTFSVGAITFNQLPENLDAMVRQADDLMYQAKNGGRNRILYQTI